MRVQPATTYRELPPEACELAAAVRTWKRRKAWERRLRWLAWALVGLCGITCGYGLSLGTEACPLAALGLVLAALGLALLQRR